MPSIHSLHLITSFRSLTFVTKYSRASETPTGTLVEMDVVALRIRSLTQPSWPEHYCRSKLGAGVLLVPVRRAQSSVLIRRLRRFRLSTLFPAFRLTTSRC
jgi:hypothetical protein